MEDIRIGRKIINAEIKDTIPNASFPFIQYDKKRVSLIFWPPPSGTLTLSVINPVVADQGISLPNTGHPIVLDVREHGDLCMKAWNVIHSVGGVVCTAHEGRLEAE
jgi:hypothetical protein